MKFYIEVKNEIGSFKGDILTGTKEMYQSLLTQLSKFHTENGYEMILEDGSYFVIGPEVLKKSVMIVHIIED